MPVFDLPEAADHGVADQARIAGEDQRIENAVAGLAVQQRMAAIKHDEIGPGADLKPTDVPSSGLGAACQRAGPQRGTGRLPRGRRPMLDVALDEGRIVREGDPEWREDVPVRVESIPVRSPRLGARVRRSMTTSSSDAFPARSPIPLIVTSA